jgi:hypothetical protein
MAYYTVKFTSQVHVTHISQDGKTQTKSRLDKPIVITALPYATAMSYSKCDNFTIEPYELEPRKASGVRGVGNATKRVDYDNLPEDTLMKAKTPKAAAKPAMTSAQKAARTGDMTGAINV